MSTENLIGKMFIKTSYAKPATRGEIKTHALITKVINEGFRVRLYGKISCVGEDVFLHDFSEKAYQYYLETGRVKNGLWFDDTQYAILNTDRKFPDSRNNNSSDDIRKLHVSILRLYEQIREIWCEAAPDTERELFDLMYGTECLIYNQLFALKKAAKVEYPAIDEKEIKV